MNVFGKILETVAPPPPEPTQSICYFINIISIVKALKLWSQEVRLPPDWHCVGTDGSDLGQSKLFPCTLLVLWWRWQLAFWTPCICKADYGVCVQINEAKTKTHNQALIRPLDRDRHINKCFGDTHTCAHGRANYGNIHAEKKINTCPFTLSFTAFLFHQKCIFFFTFWFDI